MNEGAPMYQQYLPRRRKHWPWILRWLEPNDATGRKRFLFRCSCGRALWNDAPQCIKRHHLGHRMSILEHGSVWEFAKMKLGLLNLRTFSELLKDLLEY